MSGAWKKRLEAQQRLEYKARDKYAMEMGFEANKNHP